MTNFSDFYDSVQARNIAIGGAAPLGVVLTEINYLKEQIDLSAAGQGLSITVASATVMTNSTQYFYAWFDPLAYADSTSQLCRLRMDAVIRYFSSLGYRVQRLRVGTTNYFEWIISF